MGMSSIGWYMLLPTQLAKLRLQVQEIYKKSNNTLCARGRGEGQQIVNCICFTLFMEICDIHCVESFVDKC